MLQFKEMICDSKGNYRMVDGDLFCTLYLRFPPNFSKLNVFRRSIFGLRTQIRCGRLQLRCLVKFYFALAFPGEAVPKLKLPLASGKRRYAESGPSLASFTSSSMALPVVSLSIN